MVSEAADEPCDQRRLHMLEDQLVEEDRGSAHESLINNQKP